MDSALVVERIRREAFKSNDLTARVPDFASTCKALCELLSQYPGGLSWAVILTSLASKQQVTQEDDRPGNATLASHVKGRASAASVVPCTVVNVETLSPPGQYQGVMGTRVCTGTFVLHLQDGSHAAHKPLLLYAHSSLSPLLAAAHGAQQQAAAAAVPHPQPHPWMGQRLRLAGALRQPHRVATGPKSAPQQAARPFLPSQAVLLEVGAVDPMWSAEDLAGHRLLGQLEHTRVFDLSVSHSVVSDIATQERACIHGWVSVAVEGINAAAPAEAIEPGQASSCIQVRSQVPASAEAGHISMQLHLWGDCAALSAAVCPGDELRLYSPVLCRGPQGKARLELGTTTILVVKTSPLPEQQQGSAMDVDSDRDQVAGAHQLPHPSASLPLSTQQQQPCSDAPTSLAACRGGMTGLVLFATLHRVLKCVRKVAGPVKTWLLLVELSDGSSSSGGSGGGGSSSGSVPTGGSSCPFVACVRRAVLEISDRSRVVHHLREGHALLLLGARAPRSPSDWPADARSLLVTDAATTAPVGGADGSNSGGGGGGDPCSGVLLWREAQPRSHLYDLTSLPGLLNSPSLHGGATAAGSAVAPAGALGSGAAYSGGALASHEGSCPAGLGPGIAVLEVLAAAVHTQRVHRFCGRPVVACCFDDMDEDEPQQEGPVGGATSHVAEPLSPSQDMSLDGLWECAFCGIECAPSEVGFDMHGTATVRPGAGPGTVAAGGSASTAEGSGTSGAGGQDNGSSGVGHSSGGSGGCSGGPPCWTLGADAAALRVITGTTAEAWRRKGTGAAAQTLKELLRCSRGGRGRALRFTASLYHEQGESKMEKEDGTTENGRAVSSVDEAPGPSGVDAEANVASVLARYRKRVAELQAEGKPKPDMVAAKELKELTPKEMHGHIPGVKVGESFGGRGELSILGLHTQILRGINHASAKSPLAKNGALAIVLSGGYADDEDEGTSFWYTGEGGQKDGKQVSDQSFDSAGNAALKKSYETGTPVRVFRGSKEKVKGSKEKPKLKYVYEGLYKVTGCKMVPSKDNPTYSVCKFHMVGMPGESVATVKVEYQSMYTFSHQRLGRNQLAAQAKGSGPKAKKARTDSSATRAWRLEALRGRPGLVSEDISKGLEPHMPIPLFNDINDRRLDSEFRYITDYEFAPGLEAQASDMLQVEAAKMRAYTQHAVNNGCGIEFNKLMQAADAAWMENVKANPRLFDFIGSSELEQLYMTPPENYTDDGRLSSTEPCGIHECSSSCTRAECLRNMQVTKGITVPLEVFMTWDKGWGVRCAEDLAPGAFICSYIGIVKSEAQAEELKDDCYVFSLDYFMHLFQEVHVKGFDNMETEAPAHKIPPFPRLPFPPHLMTAQDPNQQPEPPPTASPFGNLSDNDFKAPLLVDALHAGNVARFINHSCCPNLTIQGVFAKEARSVLLYYVSLFASAAIPEGTELTYDYGYHKQGISGDRGLKCNCGAPGCKGKLL